MAAINRAVLLVTPRVSHLGWMKAVAPEFDGDLGERTGYFLPEYETPEHIEEITEHAAYRPANRGRP